MIRNILSFPFIVVGITSLAIGNAILFGMVKATAIIEGYTEVLETVKGVK